MYDHLATVIGLPEPQRRFRHLAADLCQGRNAVWVLPMTADIPIMVECLLQLCREHMGCDGYWLQLCESGDEPPAIWFASQFGVDDRVSVSQIYSDLHGFDEVPEITVMSGLSELPAKSVDAWVRFVRSWAAAAHSALPSVRPKALLIPVQSLEVAAQFSADAFLAVSWLWGWVSSVEIALVARSLCHERGIGPLEALWVQSVYAGLAGGDIECLTWLIDRAVPPVEESLLYEVLVEYANERGWEGYALNGEQRSYGSASISTLAPPEQLQNLWNIGAVGIDDDGPAIHSALLAINGRTQILRHRIWAAQAKCLLPMMDHWRLMTCQELGRLYPEWAGFCARNLEEIAAATEPHAAEFSDMLGFLANGRLRPTPDREVLRKARTLRRRRNQLAHYTPLSWDGFQAVYRDCR